MHPDTRIAVLLPAYNEARHIGPVIEAILAQGVDVLVVDDGSTDATAEVADRAGARVIRQPRNQGKGVALQAGFDAARKEGYDAVITLDADGQHDPADIPRFVHAYEATGIPVLIGNRMGDLSGMPWLRRRTNRFMSWLIGRQMRQYIADTQNGYRLYQTDLLGQVQPDARGFAAESEILLNIDRMGYRMDNVPVATIYGGEHSKIRPLKDTRRFVQMMLKFYFRRRR